VFVCDNSATPLHEDGIMDRRQRAWKSAFFVAAWVGIASQMPPIQAQQPPTLPDNWQNLAAPDFANAVAPFFDLDAEILVATVDEVAVRTQAVTQIGKIDFSNTALDYTTLNTLHVLSNALLRESDQTRIRNGLLARQDNWAGRPYGDLAAKRSLMRRLKVSPELIMQEGQRWVRAGGQLSSVPPADLPEASLYFAATMPQRVTGSLGIHWRGQVATPQSGAYTFSISPINLNTQDQRTPTPVAITVSIAGNVVLTANASQWTRSSTPVNLTAGQPVPLAIDYTTQIASDSPRRNLHALLYWQGPGVANSIVPPTSLTLPDGSAPGLQATYNWTDNSGQQKTLTRTEPNLDITWVRDVWLVPNMQGLTQAGGTLLQTVTSPDYVSQFANQTVPARVRQLYPVFQDPAQMEQATGTLLTSIQRKTILDLLQSQPSLLNPVDVNSFLVFYGTYRIGNPDEALQVFGTWATQHANIGCEIPSGPVFDESNREAYRWMAIYASQQMPEQLSQLQSQFLVTPDGHCCLPIAYTLAYAYLGQNKIANWATDLDNRLLDSSITGEFRVNWLLARALVEEIRQAPPSLQMDGGLYTRPMDGKSFVDQASQAAQSPAVKVRVALEAAGRLTCTQQFDAATSALTQVQSVAPADQQPVIAAWLMRIANTQAYAASSQSPAAQKAYLDTLTQRRDQAAAQGNSAAVDRYNTLINAATASGK
jgi:hypothetical protein